MEEELEKEIQRYNEEQDGDCRYVQTARHFARWMRKQMMKEAVEGDICGDILNQHDEPYQIYAESDFLPLNGKFKMGDEVKLIIIKGN